EALVGGEAVAVIEGEGAAGDGAGPRVAANRRPALVAVDGLGEEPVDEIVPVVSDYDLVGANVGAGAVAQPLGRGLVRPTQPGPERPRQPGLAGPARAHRVGALDPAEVAA